jgi:hypothetical protein
MPNTYIIGTSTEQINLAADITTVGLAASRASVLVVDDTNPGVPVAASVDATGDIVNTVIGGGTSLKGKRLTVFTMVTLTGEDQGSRQIEADAVRGTYMLSGGDEGVKSYSDPIKSYRDPNVFTVFIVDLL